MSTPAPSPPAADPAPASAREHVTPADAPPRADDAHGEDLDLEEDIAPNLGGEDQMQDA
jgi:hypothetical protein